MTTADHPLSNRAVRQARFSRVVRELVAKHGLTAALEAEAATLLLRAGVPAPRVHAALLNLDIKGMQDNDL